MLKTAKRKKLRNSKSKRYNLPTAQMENDLIWLIFLLFVGFSSHSLYRSLFSLCWFCSKASFDFTSPQSCHYQTTAGEKGGIDYLSCAPVIAFLYEHTEGQFLTTDIKVEHAAVRWWMLDLCKMNVSVFYRLSALCVVIKTVVSVLKTNNRFIYQKPFSSLVKSSMTHSSLPIFPLLSTYYFFQHARLWRQSLGKNWTTLLLAHLPEGHLKAGRTLE